MYCHQSYAVREQEYTGTKKRKYESILIKLIAHYVFAHKQNKFIANYIQTYFRRLRSPSQSNR